MKLVKLILTVSIFGLLCSCAAMADDREKQMDQTQATEANMRYTIINNTISKQDEKFAIVLGDRLCLYDVTTGASHVVRIGLLFSMSSVCYQNDCVYYLKSMMGHNIDGLYCKSLKCGEVLSKKIIDDHIDRYLVMNDGIVYSIHEQQKDGRPAGIYFYRFSDERIVPLVQGEDGTFGNFAICGNMLVYFDKNERQMRQIDRINGGTPLTLFDISSGWIIEINVLENGDILFVDDDNRGGLQYWDRDADEISTIMKDYPLAYVVIGNELYFRETNQILSCDLKSKTIKVCFTLPNEDNITLRHSAYFEDCVIFDYSIEQETPSYWKALQHRIYVFDYEGNVLHVFDG